MAIDDVDKFLSHLHTTRLKPIGYKKERHTFVRDRNGFIERVQFQGSGWNDERGPWRFYINFGVEFQGLPPRNPDGDLPRTHCWARIDTLVTDAPREFELAADDEGVAARVATFIESASRRVGEQLESLRERYQVEGTPRLRLT